MSSPVPSARSRQAHPTRIAAFALLLLIAAIVGAVWIVPGMLDWNRYRASVAGLVAAGIGRPVSIDGDITLTLLPQPILTATRLKVDDPGAGVVLEAREVRLRVALGPLLSGRVDARELTLRGADLRLPWPPPAGALARRPPTWLTALQARVEQSRLQVGNLVASDIDASLASDPETGTLAVAGSAKIFGLSWRVTTRLGRPGRDGAAPLDVSLDGQDRLRDTGGTFSGVVAADGALSGRIAARGADLSQVLPAPPQPWRADGRLTASGGLAIADELALEIGGAPARGAVALRVQPDLRLDLALSAGQFALDPWVPVLARISQTGAEPPVPTGIDLTAEVATLVGGNLRQLRCALDIDPAGVAIREASAFLPGDAKLTLLGHFPRVERSPAFEGNATLIAPDVPATLRWLAPLAPTLLATLPDPSFRTADLAAKVTLEPSLLSFVDLHGRLDGSPAQGGLAIRLGPRLGVSASLALDQIMLDRWLPAPTVLTSLGGDDARVVRLVAGAPFDADLKLQLKKALWAGADFGPISLDAQSEVGRFTLRRLEATAYGVHATVSGTLVDGGRLSEGRLELSTQEAERLGALLPAGLDLPPALLRGPASALVQAAGPPDALGIRASAELGDLRAEAQPVANLQTRRWTGPVTLHHPGAPRLLERLGIPGTASWLGDGSFSIIAHTTVTPGRIELQDIDLVAGALRTDGQLSVADSRLTGRLHAETLPLPGLHPRSPDPLPLEPIRDLSAQIHLEAGQVLSDLTPVLRNLTVDIGLDHRQLVLRGVDANLGEGAVTGAAIFDLGGKPSLSFTAKATDVVIAGPLFGGTLDLVGGKIRGDATLTAEGFSPAALTATLTGAARVDVTDATLAGVDLSSARAALEAPPADPTNLSASTLDPLLRHALSTGTTTLTHLAVPLTAARGVLTVQAMGDNSDGALSFDGTVDLLGNTVEGRLALRPLAPLPEIAARLTGPTTVPTRTPEFAAVARWLAERPP